MKRFRVNITELDDTIEANSIEEVIQIIIKNIDIHEEKDYCDNCKEYIEQIDLNGSFGCPKCKRDDCISYELVD